MSKDQHLNNVRRILAGMGACEVTTRKYAVITGLKVQIKRKAAVEVLSRPFGMIEKRTFDFANAPIILIARTMQHACRSTNS